VFILGIDIGTQSLKAVVLGEGLRALGTGAVAYEPRFPRPLWAEQDPRLWLDALGPAIGRALAEAEVAAADVGALGIAGQLDGCIPVNRRGEALGPCLIWMDRRASAETADLPAEKVLAKGGVVLDAGHMAAKIRWLKRHHEAAQDIARFHQPTSYVVEKLTRHAVLDHAVASTSMLYNLWERRLDPELCALFGIEPAELPPIEASEALAGVLSPAGAALTGLPAGVPLAVGTGDDFSNPLGAGVVRPGRVVVSLGTAEVVGAVHGEAVIDPGALVETHGYAGQRYFVENPGWLSGGALAWAIRILNLRGVEELNALAERAPPGADGVLFLPALSGAMAPEWAAGARGAFYGLTASHGPEHLSRALLEGCAFAMRDVIDRLGALGLGTERVRLLSGGAKSRVWAEIRAGLLGQTVEVAALSDSSPVGAALLASVAAGIEPDLDAAADRLAPVTIEVEPIAAHLGVYEDAYESYRRLFAALKPMFEARP
jgi:xylulokinase